MLSEFPLMVGGMAKKSNAGGFAINFAKVVHPVCPFPPDLLFLQFLRC